MAELQIIIPSKDRAAQLDLLLRSLKAMFAEWDQQRVTILHRSTTNDYAEGYERIKDCHPEFEYVAEVKFREDLPKQVGDEPYLQFLMDDDVLVRPYSLECEEFVRFRDNPHIAALSLRMAPYMDYCYTENMSISPPPFLANRAWLWPGMRGDWGYPHSVDGSVWRTEDVVETIQHGTYTAPNNLEPTLRFAMKRPMALCFSEPRLVNIAANTVQDACAANRHGGGSAEECNKRFLGGERIGMGNFKGLRQPSPHFELDFEWESQC